MSDPVYADGTIDSDGVIRSSGDEGFVSPSEYVAGENALQPEYDTGDDLPLDA